MLGQSFALLYIISLIQQYNSWIFLHSPVSPIFHSSTTTLRGWPSVLGPGGMKGGGGGGANPKEREVVTPAKITLFLSAQGKYRRWSSRPARCLEQGSWMAAKGIVVIMSMTLSWETFCDAALRDGVFFFFSFFILWHGVKVSLHSPSYFWRPSAHSGTMSFRTYIGLWYTVSLFILQTTLSFRLAQSHNKTNNILCERRKYDKQHFLLLPLSSFIEKKYTLRILIFTVIWFFSH